MKKTLLATLLASMLVTNAFSDFIGFEVGAANWNSSVEGNIQKGSDTLLDLNDTLGLEKDTSSNYFWAVLEHPVPIIPNLKIERTNFSVSGNAKINETFNGKNFSINQDTKLVLNQTDFKIYYEILDNWVNADAGFNFKNLEGNVEIGDIKEDISAVIPMLYLKAKFDLPFSGLSAEADLNYIKFEGSNFQDIKVGIIYETSIGFGANLGYKMQNLTIDDIDSFDAKLDIKGLYFGVYYHF